MYRLTLNVNGEKHELDVAPYDSLADVLRNRLGCTEVKESCGSGECGACTVLIDGTPVVSCLMLAVKADGRQITTVKGITQDRELHPIQKKFIEHGAIQCGYCTPGMVLMAKVLLEKNPHPTEEEVREAISGNLCRCTGYQQIVEAIMAAAAEM